MAVGVLTLIAGVAVGGPASASTARPAVVGHVTTVR
jgi:hypothetical protein